MELRISPTQLKMWSECREKHRISYLLNTESVAPSIHYQFGKVIHAMAQAYWDKKTYMEAFHQALQVAQELDVRLLSSQNRTKWEALQENISPITTIYYGYHGNKNVTHPAYINEQFVESEWGIYAGVSVVCNGIIDRMVSGPTLVDTKTASAVGKDWKTDLKKRLLREPQMGFYSWMYQRMQGELPQRIEYEIIVKPYRGSEPKIEIIDVTKEVLNFQPVFEQQMNWAIKEMCEFYSKCREAEPWPMSNSACTASIFGECEFLPYCTGRAEITDSRLYKIKEPKQVEV